MFDDKRKLDRTRYDDDVEDLTSEEVLHCVDKDATVALSALPLKRATVVKQ